MKKPIIILFISMLFASSMISGCSSSSLVSSSSFTDFQKASLDEMNYARTQPAAYARERLANAKNAGTDWGAFADLTGRSAVCALKLQSQLCSAATGYAEYLAVDCASSTSPGHEENGTPSSRCAAAGYSTSNFSGENLGMCGSDEYNAEADPQTAAINFVRMLIIDYGESDPGHRNAILYSGNVTVGVGFYRNTSSYYTNYCVQDFGLK